MKRYLIPLTALVIGIGMLGGDELGTRRKEIPPRSVRMIQQAGTVVYGYAAVSTNAQEYVNAAKTFNVLPDLVNLLVTSGEVCKVRGHAWRFPIGVIQAFNLSAPHEERECAVCGKYESRAMPAWPTP